MKQFRLMVFVLLLPLLAAAQPYKEDIAAFRKQDSLQAPAKGQILFIGSSSFTRRTDVQAYFPGYPILNRAFGGSTLLNQLLWINEVVFPYDPKQIVIYCGENDFAENDSLYPAQVAERFMQLFDQIRARYKNVPILYVSMKPSPSRAHLMAKFNVANVMIKYFLKKKRRARFIDVYHKMLGPDGAPLKNIFVEDNLHMNAAGYAIWQKAIAPYLLK